MIPRLTRGEYWILNAVVEARCPLCWLGGTRPSTTFNTISGHGLERDSLIETLAELFARGWIRAEHEPECGGRVGDRFVPDRASIVSALDEPTPVPRAVHSRVYYGLTTDGGAAWEAFASPDWSRYFDWFGGECAEDERNICGASRWRLEHYLGLLADEGYVIDSGSLKWSDRVPWEATYWKTLPAGLEVKFKVLSEPDRNQQDRARWNGFVARCAFERWYDWR